jgi:hypothetical protein
MYGQIWCLCCPHNPSPCWQFLLVPFTIEVMMLMMRWEIN